VDDKGLEHLKGLTADQDFGLNLRITKVTGPGLKQLQSIKGLRSLSLDYTPIDDVGVDELKGLAQLRSLSLVHTNVTDEGVKRLRQALPNCKIGK